MTTKERIVQFIDYKRISKRKFCADAGVSHTLFNTPTSITSDNLEKISSAFPELNMDWAVSERGEMLYREPTKLYLQPEKEIHYNEPNEGYTIAFDVLKERYTTVLEKLNACLEEKDEMRKNSIQLPGAS